jgi:hypothetical protein
VTIPQKTGNIEFPPSGVGWPVSPQSIRGGVVLGSVLNVVRNDNVFGLGTHNSRSAHGVPGRAFAGFRALGRAAGRAI